MSLLEQDIRAALERAEKATPGEWRRHTKSTLTFDRYNVDGPLWTVCVVCEDADNRPDDPTDEDAPRLFADGDVEFITHARTDVPALARDLLDTREEVAAMREDYERLGAKLARETEAREAAEADNAALLSVFKHLRDFADAAIDTLTGPQLSVRIVEKIEVRALKVERPGTALLARLEKAERKLSEAEANAKGLAEAVCLANVQRDEARAALKTERESDEANRRAALENAGLLEEFGIWGCDALQHVADELAGTRRRLSEYEGKRPVAPMPGVYEVATAEEVRLRARLARVEGACSRCTTPEEPTPEDVLRDLSGLTAETVAELIRVAVRQTRDECAALVRAALAPEPGQAPEGAIMSDTDDMVEKALKVARDWGDIANGHGRWVVDQMVRALTGNRYREWVKRYEAGDEGSKTYKWHTEKKPREVVWWEQARKKEEREVRRGGK